MAYRVFESEQLFRGHTGRMFLVLTFTFICLKLTQRLLPPLLPAIIDDLAISTFSAGVALTVLRLSRAVTEYPAGRAADQLSRTVVILASLGVLILSLGILSLTFTYPMFLVGVILIGISLSLWMPASRALLSDVFQEKRGRAFGLHFMGSDIAGILAAGLAVWIVATATWRGAFLPLLLVSIPLPLIIYFFSREQLNIEPLNLEFRDTGGRLLEDTSIRWLAAVYALRSLANAGVMSFLPVFLMEVQGVSFVFASSAFALVYAIGLIAKPPAGYLSDALPRSKVAGSGLLIGSIGIGIMTFAPNSMIALVGVVTYALGLKSFGPALSAFLMDRFQDDNMAGDFGAVRTVQMAVGSLGPSITGFIAGTLGFIPAYIGLGISFLMGAVILIWFSIKGWPE